MSIIAPPLLLCYLATAEVVKLASDCVTFSLYFKNNLYKNFIYPNDAADLLQLRICSCIGSTDPIKVKEVILCKTFVIGEEFIEQDI